MKPPWLSRALDRQIDRAPPPGEVGGYNQFWMDRGIEVNENRRTSLIVDPPDGRLPPLAEGAVHQPGSLLADIPGERPVRYRAGGIGADGPEDRGLAERCLLGFNVGPPMRPGGYNNNMQLFQTADQVVILQEMVHDFRVIPLDGRPHLPGHMRQWLGSSRGRWEGDTLVVETANLTDKTPAYDPNGTTGLGVGANMHLVERFSRTADDVLLYEYTLTDPATFTRPFTVAIHMRRGEAPLFEYACHEGNYGMFDILAGGRHQEREGASGGRLAVSGRGWRPWPLMLILLLHAPPAGAQQEQAAEADDPRRAKRSPAKCATCRPSPTRCCATLTPATG